MNIQVRMFSGEICKLYTPDLSVATIRSKLYDQYVGKNGRNEVVHLFSNNQELHDHDDYKNDEENMENMENMILAFIDYEKKMKKEETKKVEEALFRHVKEAYFENFRKHVQKAKALVAGGSILASFGGYKINDLDVYVHYSNAQQFIKDLHDECNYGMLPYGAFHLANQYDQSFFRKNNILARFCLVQKDRHLRRTMDVMVIPDDYPIENVVTNFDLSFCEIWWDGENVYANDPFGVRTKSGILKPDYRKSLFEEMNTFIIRRMQKYRSRGFKIDIGIAEFAASIQDSQQELILVKPSKVVESSLTEAWAITKFIEDLFAEIYLFFNNFHSRTTFSTNLYFSFFPQKLSYPEFLEKVSKTISENNITALAHFFIKEGNARFFKSPYKEMYTQIFSISPISDVINLDTRIQIFTPILQSLLDDNQLRTGIEKYRNYYAQNHERHPLFNHFEIAIRDNIENYVFDEVD